MTSTETFKFQKSKLVEEGFDLSKIRSVAPTDLLFVESNDEYIPLTDEIIESLARGDANF